MMRLAQPILLMVVGGLIAVMFHLSAAASDLNTVTHCDVDGLSCVDNCAVYRGVSLAEDVACWLITSTDSDLEVPVLLRFFGARDYR